MSPPQSRPALPLLLAIGIIVFAGGVSVALLRLPEWRNRDVPDRTLFASRLREVAKRAGIEVESEPQTRLLSNGWLRSGSDVELHETAYETLGPRAADWLVREGRGPFVEATAKTRWPTGGSSELRVLFSTRGVPLAATWMPEDLLSTRSGASPQRDASRRALMRLVAPAAAAEKEVGILGQIVHIAAIPGTDPPETLVAIDVSNVTAPVVQRVAGSEAWWRTYLESTTVGSLLIRALPRAVIATILYLGTLGLFVMLLARRRIELSKGAILAAVSIALSVASPIRESASWIVLVDALVKVLSRALVLFILWATAESWLRSMIPNLRTSLDTLRAGRLGPKAGRALLAGWAVGAAAGGMGLVALAMAPVFGVAPTDGSVHLPAFGVTASPIDEGAMRTGLVLLAICAAMRLPLLRRLRGAATVLAALFLATRIPLTSFWFATIAGLAIAVILVRGYAAFGLTALLSASVTSTVLPAAVFSLLHAPWLTPSTTVLATFAIAPVAFAAIGMRRPPEVEERPYAAPAFVRRLETENRLKYEMDLLARMQLGLLPRETPNIGGYEIAARSILATEAGGDLYDFVSDSEGRLWIAAGDVSGHGYSCAIAQAMTKAGLASLVEANRTPAMVLDRLDRVLRGIGSPRTFTTLALLRLDIASGDALLANAGHPYAWLITYEEARELELPSLPLGQGPPRSYADTALTLERGASLVFLSDGLFESPDPNGHPYGFDRLRRILRKVPSRPAAAIVEAIVQDWREHVGPDAPPDDTTIVVVKRKA